MRWSAILREAWRNITSGTARTVKLALVLAVVSVGLTAADLVAVRAITTAAETYQSAGASVITLAAPGRIDGTACEALAAVPGIRAAGAIRSSENGIVAAALPSTSIPVKEVTAGFPALLHADTVAQAGIVLSDQAATTLDRAPGDTLATRAGEATVSGVYAYPDDGRRAGYGYAALVPVPDGGAFDECWVDVWPTSTQTPMLLQMALTPADQDGEQAVLSQLNTTLGTRFDGHDRFADRITRHGPLIALTIGAGLGYLAVRSRRIQLASALHAGLRKPALALILALETLSWTAPTAMLTAAFVAVFVATGSTGESAASVLLGLRIGLLAVATPFLGAAVALALTRERDLFRYFKDR